MFEVAFDGAGNIIVPDPFNNRRHQINAITGAITTVTETTADATNHCELCASPVRVRYLCACQRFASCQVAVDAIRRKGRAR
jgi:hypothetical protein